MTLEKNLTSPKLGGFTYIEIRSSKVAPGHMARDLSGILYHLDIRAAIFEHNAGVF
jgi:hypothetical protein